MAVLGCGAVAERLHLPAIREVEGLQATVLVDTDVDRARIVGHRFGIRDVRNSFDGLSGDVDSVLVALPNRLHAPAAIEFLSRGIPVLVEKPMALSEVEGRAMISASVDGSVVLQVAQMKRFTRGARLIKKMLDEGLLGTPLEFSVEWGLNFDWPLTSGSGMNRSEAGGGVLMDFGSHFLDLVCWWLGEPDLEDYRDDAKGGVEADCELSLSVAGPLGRVPGQCRFSRLRPLSNVVRIRGERMTLVWEHDTTQAVRILPTTWDEEPPSFTWEMDGSQSFQDLFVAQLGAFVTAVSNGEPSPVSGESVLPSVALIERCYRQRRTKTELWERPVRVPGRDTVGSIDDITRTSAGL